ncbi:response regulator [Bdellovibrionota bacterium FG-2]
MGKLIFHVDDSSTATRMAGNVFKQLEPDCEFKGFLSGAELTAALEVAPELPWIIFSDVNMPGMNGWDVLSWIKRHPKFHVIPVVMLTAEVSDEDRVRGLKDGAFEYLGKPATAALLQSALKKREELGIEYSALFPIDQDYAEEGLDLISECHRFVDQLDEAGVKEIYRAFHTVKGGANSLQFPALGAFMHHAEGLLTAIRNGNLFALPQTKELLFVIFSYVEEQCEKIKAKVLLEMPPQKLFDDITLVKSNVAAGWNMAGASAVPVAAGAPEGSPDIAKVNKSAEGGDLPGGVISRSSSSTRLSNEKLNEIQLKFKKIMTHKVRLSSFANKLKGEFFDEEFPNDLLKIVEGLNNDAMEVMDFFISLRVVPASRLKIFSERVVSQTSDQLGKPARLEFRSDEGLEIDQAVVECMEAGLLHLLRNSVDHGLEVLEKRTAAGKDPVGLIKLSIERSGDENVLATIIDDGGGINAEGLKAAVAKKSLIAKEVLEKLKEKEIYELVFIDGLSTREEVSDVSGRGVGLGAVKQKIVDMGGKVEVDSTLGKGTVFNITLPRIFRL